MVAEMEMMKEMMDFMMNTLRGQVSSDLDELVHQTESSFTTPITPFPISPKFHMPLVEAYDGLKDPLDHLESFKPSCTCKVWRMKSCAEPSQICWKVL